MKKKTLYLLTLICLISLISFARQSGRKCDVSALTNKINPDKQVQKKAVTKTDFEFTLISWL